MGQSGHIVRPNTYIYTVRLCLCACACVFVIEWLIFQSVFVFCFFSGTFQVHLSEVNISGTISSKQTTTYMMKHISSSNLLLIFFYFWFLCVPRWICSPHFLLFYSKTTTKKQSLTWTGLVEPGGGGKSLTGGAGWGQNITKDLTWNCHVTAVVKKGQQHLYDLRRRKQFGLRPNTTSNLYRGTIESVLTSSFTAWYGSCTDKDLRDHWVSCPIWRNTTPSVASTSLRG